MLKDIIHRLIHNKDPLSSDDIAQAVAHILQGQCGEAEIAAFLTATACHDLDETHLSAVSDCLMQHAITVPPHDNAFDCCGTGGDGLHTLNISTAVSFTLAGCGVVMAKHGNRSASSKSGAADVLEACGIKLISDPQALHDAMDRLGYAFLMAPNHHPALKPLSVVRKAIGIRTVFNLTGPLVNPACVTQQLVGTYSPQAQELLVKTYAAKPKMTAWVVNAEDGMDELSIASPTRVMSSDGDSWVWRPSDFDLPCHPLDAITGGDADYNATALQALLNGAEGAYHDAVVLNSAACLLMLKKANSTQEAAAMARASLTQGSANTLFNTYREWSNQHG